MEEFNSIIIGGESMKIRLFTTPDCPFSKKTRDLLRKHSLDFEDNNVLVSKEAREEMIKISGQMAVPVIEIEKSGEKTAVIRGYNEPEIRSQLNLGGE